MVDSVSLGPSVRETLSALQRIRGELGEVQENLAAGQKINSALEDPQNFLAARSLNQEAEALLATKERIGGGITVLEAANSGVESVQSLLDEGESLAQQALDNLGSDSGSVAERRELAKDFNKIVQEIGGVVADAGVDGTNLLKGNGRSFTTAADSRAAVTQFPGIDGARATNIAGAENFGVSVTGAGTIGASGTDVSDAETARGLKNLRVSGLNARSEGNLKPLEITVEGQSGEDRTVTVTEGEQSVTQSFDKDVIQADPQRFRAQFDSGTEVTFDVDAASLNAADNDGEGTSTIAKTVGLEVGVKEAGGAEVRRDGSSASGNRRLFAGENAFPLPDATLRLDVNPAELQQAADFPNTLSAPLGRTPEAIKDIRPGSGFSFDTADIGGDTRYNLVVNIGNDSFDSDAGTYAQLGTKLEYQRADGTTVTAPGGTLSGDATITFNDADGAGGTLKADLDYDALHRLVASSAATAGEVDNTFESLSGSLGSGDVSVEADPTGFRRDFVSTLDVSVEGINDPQNNANVSIADNDEGTAAQEVVQNQTATFTLSGGINDGAQIELLFSNLTSFNGPSDTAKFSYDVRGEFTAPGSTSVIAREGQSTDTRFLETVQSSPAGDANQRSVPLNPDNTNQLTLEPADLRPTGTGLGLEPAPNSWRARDDVQLSLDQIAQARSRTESASTGFSTDLTILQGRQDFNDASAQLRQDRADRLVGTDLTGEAARLKALEAREKLAQESLSIAGNNRDAILGLIGGGGSASSSQGLFGALFG